MNAAAEIFLSHVDEDEDSAETIGNALRSQGWSVWREGGAGVGGIVAQASETVWRSAQCVLVLWSSASRLAPDVLEQARSARADGRLVSVLIEDVELPDDLDGPPTIDLVEWSGDEAAIEFLKLVAQITTLVIPRAEPVSPDAGHRGAEAEPSSDRIYDENVQFTVYRPDVLVPQTWQTMLAYAHLAEAQSEGDPDPVEEVDRLARQMLGEAYEDFSTAGQDAGQAVPREGVITFVPSAEGIDFNPPRRTFVWQEPIHQEAFRLRVTRDLDGHTARGRLSVYLGVVLLAEVNLRFRVHAGARDAPPRARASARPFRRIFPSYSHRDGAIVGQFGAYCRALGDEYLRDVAVLRSGEIWSERIQELIASADVFQLFWSHNAIGSPYVEQEWRYALTLSRPGFIRPVYWEQPLPRREHPRTPPEELTRLHFEFIGAMSETAAPAPPGAPAAAPSQPAAGAPAAPRRESRARPGCAVLCALALSLLAIALWWALG